MKMLQNLIENVTKLILYVTNETISQISDNLHIEGDDNENVKRKTKTWETKNENYTKVRDAVVTITCLWDNDERTSASGFFFRSGTSLICTCSHVVWRKVQITSNKITEPKIMYATMTCHNDKDIRTTMHEVELVGLDGLGDIAILKIMNEKIIPACTLPFARKRPSTSDEIMIIGDLFGYDHQSCAKGHVRDARWTDVTLHTLLTCVTTDVSTGPGNSGSPIINMNGECIGMHIGAFGNATTQFGGGVASDILEKIVNSLTCEQDLRIHKRFPKSLLPFKIKANVIQNQIEFKTILWFARTYKVSYMA